MDLRLRHGRDGLIGGMRRQRRHRPPAGRQRASSLASATSSAGILPALAMRSSTRSRAARAPHGPNDPAGAVRAIAAARPAAPPPRAKASSAPCRNRRATPRGCLRDCRRRAQASGKAPSTSSLLRLRSISMARTIWRSLAPSVRSVARLEQPRDLHGQGRAAGNDAAVADELNGRAHHRQRIDAPVLAGNAGPRRSAASRRSADRRRSRSPAAASGPPASHRPAAAGRCGRAPAPRVRHRRDRATGPSVRTHHAPPATAAMAAVARVARMSAAWSSSHHFGAISIVPVPVRPKRSGRYMSST